MRLRRLIINADDFGLTPGVNRAIAEANRLGIVTSSTLMACGAAFQNAIELSREVPSLGVGCHVVLIDGIPIADSAQISSLCDSSNGNEFRRSLVRFALAANIGRLSANEVEAEVAAQLRRLRDAGISVSHVDTHKHAHMFPQILKPILRAAKACGVRAIRNPFGPIRWGDLAAQPRLWKRWIQVKALGGLARRFKRETESAGLRTTDGTVGILATGSLTEDTFRNIVTDLPDGTWEFVCHPGYVDADLRKVRTRLVESRAQELSILTSVEARSTLQKAGIELVSYRNLA